MNYAQRLAMFSERFPDPKAKLLAHLLTDVSEDNFDRTIAKLLEPTPAWEFATATTKSEDSMTPSTTPSCPMSRRLRMLQQHYAPAVAAEMEGKLAALPEAEFERFIADIARITGAATAKAAEELTAKPIPQATTQPAPMAAPPRRINSDAPPKPAGDEQEKLQTRGEVRDFIGNLLGVPDDDATGEVVEYFADRDKEQP